MVSDHVVMQPFWSKISPKTSLTFPHDSLAVLVRHDQAYVLGINAGSFLGGRSVVHFH